MLIKNNQTADIIENQGTDRQADVLSRGVNQCCPFLNRARYHKTQSLKDKSIFFTLNGGRMEKKQKMNNEIDNNTGTSMMSYL